MIYEIKNKKISAKINSFGAELISLVKNGEEKIWQNGDGKWDGHAPVLFPVCGHVLINYQGKFYEVNPHGFAMSKEFRLVKKSKNKVVFSLLFDEETLSVYPFRFEFRLTYVLKGDVLVYKYKVKNLDDKALYFSIGGHESFVINGKSDEYTLKFPCDEVFVNYCNDENGYLTGKTEILGQGNTLPVLDKYFEQTFSLIFKELNSKKVKLIKGEKEIAEIKFKGFDVLLVWKEFGSEFICIEPWLNLPDSTANINDNIENKFGFIKLSKGKTKKLKQKIKYTV